MLPFPRSVSLLILPVALLAQTARVSMRPALGFNSIPPPPVPASELELVTGDAQPVQDAQQRVAALDLLNNARALSNVRAQAYDLKTTFTSSGGVASDGSWTLEDMAPAASIAGRRRGRVTRQSISIRTRL